MIFRGLAHLYLSAETQGGRRPSVVSDAVMIGKGKSGRRRHKRDRFEAVAWNYVQDYTLQPGYPVHLSLKRRSRLSGLQARSHHPRPQYSEYTAEALLIHRRSLGPC